jgi:LTXXQ motif family protein
MCSYMSRTALAALMLMLMLIAAAAPAGAQSQPAGPYAGLQTRAIKALSDQEIADLTAGRGIGSALPAELNGYPGPTHVLEHADQLGLTEQQRAEVQRLFDSMKSEAIPLGQKLIAAERELDRDFAQRTITPERLKVATAAIAEIRGELRNTHLKYHLSTAALLAPEQIRRYAELRGYGTTGAAPAAANNASVNSMHQHMMRHD